MCYRRQGCCNWLLQQAYFLQTGQSSGGNRVLALHLVERSRCCDDHALNFLIASLGHRLTYQRFDDFGTTLNRRPSLPSKRDRILGPHRALEALSDILRS